MMRSLSTSALGQPSEMKLTFGVRRLPMFGLEWSEESYSPRRKIARRGLDGRWRVGWVEPETHQLSPRTPASRWVSALNPSYGLSMKAVIYPFGPNEPKIGRAHV